MIDSGRIVCPLTGIVGRQVYVHETSWREGLRRETKMVRTITQFNRLVGSATNCCRASTLSLIEKADVEHIRECMTGERQYDLLASYYRFAGGTIEPYTVQQLELGHRLLRQIGNGVNHNIAIEFVLHAIGRPDLIRFNKRIAGPPTRHRHVLEIERRVHLSYYAPHQ